MEIKDKEKYIEVIAALYWMFSFLLLPICTASLVLYIAFFTNYSYLSFLYMCWLYYDKETPFKGGRKLTCLRYHSYWKYFKNYFPIKMFKTEDLNGDKNYIFCYYPHGVFPAGFTGCFGNDYLDCNQLFPELNIHNATLDMNFHFPLYREYNMGMGAISASKESLKYVLNDKYKGNVAVLAVGGAAESYYATPGPYRIVLKRRRGFVKIALEEGASLVPVFGFGELELFKQYNSPGTMLHKLQSKAKKYLPVAPLIPHGQCGWLPYRSPINVVVGRAIDIPKIPNPTDEDIEKYHTLFIEELIRVFNDNKDKYITNGELIIE